MITNNIIVSNHCTGNEMPENFDKKGQNHGISHHFVCFVYCGHICFMYQPASWSIYKQGSQSTFIITLHWFGDCLQNVHTFVLRFTSMILCKNNPSSYIICTLGLQIPINFYHSIDSSQNISHHISIILSLFVWHWMALSRIIFDHHVTIR